MEHQVTKDSDPWEMKNKSEEPYACSSLLSVSSQAVAQEPKLRRWSWNSREAKTARVHKTDC